MRRRFLGWGVLAEGLWQVSCCKCSACSCVLPTGCRGPITTCVHAHPSLSPPCLYRLQVSQEEGVWRQGLDLHSQLQVPVWDALLGGTATVATLRGAASLAIPPGTPHGAVLTLQREGVEREGGGPASRGAHHFRVSLQLPRQVSGAEQTLLQRLAELQQQRRADSSHGSGSKVGDG